MEAKLEKLNINTTANVDIPKAKKSAPVVDSWEDDSDTDVGEMDRVVNEDRAKPSSMPEPPPPTPASPQGFPSWNAIDAEVAGTGTRSPASRSTPRDDNTRRQEKSTAVASRMIAAGLGVKAPKRTEEQRAYDRAAKEAEIRKRNKERQDAAKAQEEEAKIKDAVWES